MLETIRRAVDGASNRSMLLARFLRAIGARRVAEVGVYRGEFAMRTLRRVPSIERYYMIDPWRHLDDWHKPANRDDTTFESFYREALERTEFASDKRVVLRGTTSEVVDQVADGELDIAYIDGDHTLRGITIDLVRWLPKVRQGGWIAGDDFVANCWQHGRKYDPTLVFPFAVHFAEAHGLPIVGLPYRQFLIHVDRDAGHSFVDLADAYPTLELRVLLADGT